MSFSVRLSTRSALSRRASFPACQVESKNAMGMNVSFCHGGASSLRRDTGSGRREVQWGHVKMHVPVWQKQTRPSSPSTARSRDTTTRVPTGELGPMPRLEASPGVVERGARHPRRAGVLWGHVDVNHAPRAGPRGHSCRRYASRANTTVRGHFGGGFGLITRTISRGRRAFESASLSLPLGVNARRDAGRELARSPGRSEI